ncbi:MAG: hypothetical protein C0608_10195 [Deltaproteobacteria bacterium]|nr:MAG: hypothetical protein C0608_10195 [Deltaproteobacteria bacterium]
MICERCKADVTEDEIVDHGSQQVCEDCAMTLMSPSKACDPWAVKMASSSIGSKEDAVKALKEPELSLYNLVISKGRVPREEIAPKLGLEASELERAFSVLRHMELLRGEKRADNGVDILPFDK